MSRPLRRIAVAAVVLACCAATAGCDRGEAPRAAAHPPAATRSPTPSHSPSPSPSPSPVSYPLDGPETYTVAPGRSRVLGRSGTLLRFQVAVEHGIDDISVPGVADQVVSILGDPRDWTAGGDWRFQRVGPGADHDFTLYLVTPVTRDHLCGTVVDRYTSCRNGDAVVINVSRWVHGVPYFHDLDAYRAYAVSHEVGHRLGHGHELCPGRGRPAPTMVQQTLGLHGCTPNPWPYLHGRRYAGPSGEYPIDVPTDPSSYYRHDR